MTSPHALPLFLQISEMLNREIRAGRLVDGERLPPERDMAKDLGLAVGTLRKALAELEAQGVLERRQGSGNYIRYDAKDTGIYAFFRLETITGGGLPTAELISLDTIEKPSDLPPFGTHARAHRIRRLRYLDGEPAALEEIWLDASYAEEITADGLSESLYLFYRTRLGFWINRAEDRVGLGKIPDWAPDRFGLRPGAACGHVARLSWAQSDAPAEYSQTWFDTGVARYTARLK
jgi:GntR family transcriptional regulator